MHLSDANFLVSTVCLDKNPTSKNIFPRTQQHLESNAAKKLILQKYSSQKKKKVQSMQSNLRIIFQRNFYSKSLSLEIHNSLAKKPDNSHEDQSLI